MVINWELCAREFVKIVERDENRVKSIIKRATERLSFIELSQVNKNNVSFIVEGYYEVIKELLVAYLLKDGLKSSNHQCLISYFYKKNPQYEKEVNFISQLSFFRNRLNYYGDEIPFDFYEENKDDFKKLIKLLLGLLNGVKR